MMGKPLFSDICGWLMILEVYSLNLRSQRLPELWVCGCLQETRGAGPGDLPQLSVPRAGAPVPFPGFKHTSCDTNADSWGLCWVTVSKAALSRTGLLSLLIPAGFSAQTHGAGSAEWDHCHSAGAQSAGMCLRLEQTAALGDLPIQMPMSVSQFLFFSCPHNSGT